MVAGRDGLERAWAAATSSARVAERGAAGGRCLPPLARWDPQAL